MSSAGKQVGGTSSQPLVGDVGQLVTAVGNTVTNAGGLVNPNGPNGAAPIPGLITSLVGGSTATVQNGSSSGSGSTNPLGGLLSGLGST
ncbi:collagen-like triple helix repeat-containing protein, partial [Burkholderia cenocepacia]|uniref:collagen-like triple helix repeat-containing protein n=1 Tax=Burkholderia cenocepacia TaxID=95486 RepID=UPI0038574F4D